MSLNGIDISNWQNGIDLAAVPCDFVIVKVTEGKSYVSPDSTRQIAQAKKLNKLLGVYHYADGGNMEEEADHFIKHITDNAILVLDWETQNNKTWDKSNDRAWVKGFCDRVFSKTGIKPILYIQKSAMDRFKDLGYELWVAQYANMNETGYQDTPWNEGAYDCLIRQYSARGKLKGFNEYLDLDKFYGTSEDWKAQASKKAVNTPEGTTLNLAYNTVMGIYGNGEARKTALGTRYDEVQAFINHIASASVETLKNETVNGVYGNGDVRKAVLGSRYDAVQKAINGSAKKSVEKVAKEVIDGKWGNGLERKRRLEEAGYNFAEVQAVVNKLL